MSLVMLEGFGISYGAGPILSDVNFTIKNGEKIGLVGDNGAGKSSLLLSIAKKTDAYTGRLTHSKGLRCHYVAQGFSEEWNALTVIDVLEGSIADLWADKWRAEYTLELFDFPRSYHRLQVGQLSGGWKKVLMIANAFLLEPDLLLLDEPTNHLDQEHIRIITRAINNAQLSATLVIASHNRDFLDAVTERTLFIHDKKTIFFKVPFTQARTLLKESILASAESRNAALVEICKLKKSAEFNRQIGVNNYSDRALQKAKQIEKRVRALEDAVPSKMTTLKKPISLAIDDFNAKKIIRIENYTVCTPDGVCLFKIDELTIRKGDRLVIFGPNGSGKSVLLKAISSGAESSIRLGPSVHYGLFDQELSSLPLNLSALDYLLVGHELGRQSAINELASTGFSYSDAQKKINTLSYGERARLLVLSLRLQRPNFLILDEPTNHLDISSQEMLEAEIHRLNPAAIIVSHDARFIENVGTRFYEIQGGVLKARDSLKACEGF